MNAHQIAQTANLSSQDQPATLDVSALMADSLWLASLPAQRAFERALSALPSIHQPLSFEQAMALAQSHALNGALLNVEASGLTPLQRSCELGLASLTAALCHWGTDPSALNSSGVSALSSALSLRHFHCAKTLIDAGASLDAIASEESGLERSAPLACSLAGFGALARYAGDRLSAQRELRALDAASAPGSRSLKPSL